MNEPNQDKSSETSSKDHKRDLPRDPEVAEVMKVYPGLSEAQAKEMLDAFGAGSSYTKLEMLPTNKPVLLESGSLARLSSIADGGAKIETFSPETKSWKEGGATAGDFMSGKFSDVTPDALSKLGLSPEDIN